MGHPHGFLKDDTGISTIEMPDGRFSGATTDYIQYAAGCLNQKSDVKLTEYNSDDRGDCALKSDEIDMTFHFQSESGYSRGIPLRFYHTA